jgi:hypothetical protein
MLVQWLAPASLSAVTLEWSSDNGHHWSALATKIPNTGSALVKLPATPSPAARLRMSPAMPADGPAAEIGELALTQDGDIVPPSITVRSPEQGAVTGPSLHLAGSADDPSGIASVEVRRVGATDWQPATGRSTWIFSPGVLPAGEHRFEIRARDLAIPPNLSQPVTQTFTVDSEAPQIRDLSAQRTSNGVLVQWTTEEPSSSRVQWGNQSGVYEGETGVTEENVTAHRVRLPAHTARAEPLFLIAISADSCGNTATSPELAQPLLTEP